MMQKTWKMTETPAHEFLSESTQWEQSHEYQHDRVKVVFKKFCVLVLWTKVASALEEIVEFDGPTPINPLEIVIWIYGIFENNFAIENDFTRYLKESCW